MEYERAVDSEAPDICDSFTGSQIVNDSQGSNEEILDTVGHIFCQMRRMDSCLEARPQTDQLRLQSPFQM